MYWKSLKSHLGPNRHPPPSHSTFGAVSCTPFPSLKNKWAKPDLHQMVLHRCQRVAVPRSPKVCHRGTCTWPHAGHRRDRRLTLPSLPMSPASLGPCTASSFSGAALCPSTGLMPAGPPCLHAVTPQGWTPHATPQGLSLQRGCARPLLPFGQAPPPQTILLPRSVPAPQNPKSLLFSLHSSFLSPPHLPLQPREAGISYGKFQHKQFKV